MHTRVLFTVVRQRFATAIRSARHAALHVCVIKIRRTRYNRHFEPATGIALVPR